MYSKFGPLTQAKFWPGIFISPREQYAEARQAQAIPHLGGQGVPAPCPGLTPLASLVCAAALNLLPLRDQAPDTRTMAEPALDTSPLLCPIELQGLCVLGSFSETPSFKTRNAGAPAWLNG